jgi:PAS domain S-box-containing protein
MHNFMTASRVFRQPRLLFHHHNNDCAKLIEAIDWTKTSLGPMEEWPRALHITLGIILNSKFPMFIFWGPDHICFYNDASRVGSQRPHPFSLGKRAEVVWSDRWHIIKPMIDKVLTYGETTWNEDERIPVSVNGHSDEVFSTFSYSPIYDDAGHRVGVLVSGMDTTEKIKSIKKLRESEKNFRNLIAQAPLGIAILKGRDFIVEIANDNFLELCDRTSSIIGLPLKQALPEMTEQQYPELLTKVMLSGISYHGKEYPVMLVRNGNQEDRYVNFVYEPMKETDGSIKRIMVTVFDVTEQVMARNRSEEIQKELRQLADAMPHLVWIANERGEITYVNDRVSEYLGLTKKEDGRWYWSSICHPDDMQSTIETYMKAIISGSFYEKEHRLQMSDGSYKWHLSRAFPYYNENGKAIKWFGTATDFDEQKKLSEQLEQRVEERTRELERSNKELEQFAYVASHDLQEPLRKIITFIQLVERNSQNLDEKSKEYLDKIAHSSHRMSTLIKDILNFSQLSKSQDEYPTLDLNKCLQTIISDFELVIEQKRAIIKFDPLPVIQGVALQMTQLFYNLISNSLKFVEEGRQPVIYITSRILSKKEVRQHSGLDPSETYYRIQLRDNGIGFDQQYAEEIFTIFQRLNNRQAYSGTGIGLALCKKIVMHHKGQITATSKPNEGAVFTLILPARQPD